MFRITKDTVIEELLQRNPDYADVLMDCGMHCVSCPSAAHETLEEACDVHGLFVEDVLEAITEFNEAWEQLG